MSQHKTLTCFALFFFLFSTAKSQKPTTYYLDSALHIVPKKSDNYFFKCTGVRADSVFSIDCRLPGTDNLRVTAHFSDSLLTDLHGPLTRYYMDGTVEAKQFFVHGVKTGVWQSWDKAGNKTDSAVYVNNERRCFAAYFYSKTIDNKPALFIYQFTDSLKNSFRQVRFSTTKTIISDAEFIGETGVEKIYENGKTTIDTVYTRAQEEATFPGGNMGWARYVQKAVGAFNPGENGASKGTHRVIVKFTIDTDGHISEVTPETNFGYGMENKAVEIITKGPDWIPAKRFGRPVKAFRRQPLTFVVEGKY